MAKVTIEVELDSRWVKVVRSPVYFIVASLQGVSLTFAPMFLYWSGRGWFGGWKWIVMPLCFATILLVGTFFMVLGSSVVAALRRE